MYAKFFKRFLDFILSLGAVIVLLPILLMLIILGTIFMGGNPFFYQDRPGKGEKIFKLIKFRSMDNRKDEDGNLLPDNARINKYGRFLRSTSLDELPELINILKGDMSIIGPRPLLVRYLPKKRNRYVSVTVIINVFVSCLYSLYLWVLYKNKITDNWTREIAVTAVVAMSYELIILINTGRNLYSFEIWFIILSYLFMFGRILLVRLFGVNSIVALGYNRPVFDSRYSYQLMFDSSIFILLCIHAIFIFFTFKRSINNTIDKNDYDWKLYNASLIMLTVGIPCHLVYSIRMIFMAQTSSSYNAIVDESGFIDDFANFMIFGIICLIYSYGVSRRKIKFIILTVVGYLVIVMALTGDRRYQVVSIIVISLSYMRAYKSKFSFKYIGYVFACYLLLNLFYVLREIRSDSLVGLGDFASMYYNNLLPSDNNIFIQTLYEFGGSFYTVCLAIKFVPNTIYYKLGQTFISGLLSIIPLGFLYNNSDLFQNGRVAAQLTKLGKTTVGGSVYADLFSNFGFVGAIVGSYIIGLLLAKLFNNRKGNITVNYLYSKYYILFYALINLTRSSINEVFRAATWGVFFLWLTYNMGKNVSAE